MRIGLKPSQPVYDPLSHATKEDKASAKAIISSGGHDALRNLLVWAIGLVTVFLEFGVLIMTFRLGILSGNSAEGLSLLAFFGAWAAAYLGGKFVIMPAQFRRVLREVIVKRLAKVSESEVARLTESEAECERIYQRQSAALVAQTQLYRKIESQIENAEGLFRERAFTPFWENVDQCIAALHGLESKTKQVHEDARKYFELLAERPHTFPDFPISAGQMPAADGLVGHLSVIVRSAQKDFQFASIYEQRRTTRAVTMGFRNINEVITDLGRALASSVAEFNNSIAAHTERFEEKAASDAAHQEVVEAALNELQKPRKQRR